MLLWEDGAEGTIDTRDGEADDEPSRDPLAASVQAGDDEPPAPPTRRRGRPRAAPRRADADWRTQLRSPRWGTRLEGDRLPKLKNPEMNPTSTVPLRAVLARPRRRDLRHPRRRLRHRASGRSPAPDRPRGSLRRPPPILHRLCDSFPGSSTRTTASSDGSSRSSTRRTPSKPSSRRSPTRRSAPRSPSSAPRSYEAAAPDEPSEDELHHPDLERRRELTKDRRKRENERLQEALDDVAARGLRDDPRGHEADARDAPLRRPAASAAWSSTRARSPRCGPARARPSSRRWPRSSTRWPAAASTSSPSTTTSPGATRSGWARSSTSSGVSVGMITHDASFLFEPGLPDDRRAAASTCARSRAARRTPPTSPTARTTSSGSTTCATTWSSSSTSGSSASAASRSSTRSTTSSSTRRGRR